MLFMRNAVHSALLLILNFFTLAVFFLMLGSPFLFVVQIIVYAGAIMVLFLFVIMLLGVDREESLRGAHRRPAVGGGRAGDRPGRRGRHRRPPGRRAVGWRRAGDVATLNRGGNVKALAEVLFSSYFFPFEVDVGAADRRRDRRDAAGAPPSDRDAYGRLARRSGRRRPSAAFGDGARPVRTPIAWYLVVSVLLFTIGTVGVLVRRNALVIFMSVELQLNAVNLALVAFSRRWGSVTGQVLGVLLDDGRGGRGRGGTRDHRGSVPEARTPSTWTTRSLLRW